MGYPYRDTDEDARYDDMRAKEDDELRAFESWLAKERVYDVIDRNSAWKAWMARAT